MPSLLLDANCSVNIPLSSVNVLSARVPLSDMCRDYGHSCTLGAGIVGDYRQPFISRRLQHINLLQSLTGSGQGMEQRLPSGLSGEL